MMKSMSQTLKQIFAENGPGITAVLATVGAIAGTLIELNAFFFCCDLFLFAGGTNVIKNIQQSHAVLATELRAEKEIVAIELRAEKEAREKDIQLVSAQQKAGMMEKLLELSFSAGYKQYMADLAEAKKSKVDETK
jgi:hypothetical protein